MKEIKFEKDGDELTAVISKYACNNRVALKIHDEDGPYASVSVNLADEELGDDELAIDSLGREFIGPLVKAGILLQSHRSIEREFPSWTIKYKVCRLDPLVVCVDF